MNITKMIKKNYLIILIVVLAFTLRMLFFQKNFFFGFEQGRDLLKERQIMSGDLTLIGPKTDIEGIFHGAFSYYVLVPPFVVFNGNPYLIQVFFILLNCVSILFLYKAVEELFDKKVALISTFFYSISYSAIIYARWLSNPTLVPTITIFILYLLTRLKKYPYLLIIIASFWTVIFHLELIAAITLIPGIVYYLLFQKVKINLKVFLLSIVSVIVFFSPYLLFNFRNNNILLNGVFNYLSAAKTPITPGVNRIGEFINEIVDGVFPVSRIIAFGIFIFLLASVFALPKLRRNNKFIMVLIFLFTGPIFYFLVGVNALRHFYVTVPIFLSILGALATGFLLQKKNLYLGFLVIVLILFGNILAIKNRLPKSVANFLYHAQHMYMYDEIKLLDYIYQDANGNVFSYDYYSIPYWKNEAWEYLFAWYGDKKYGYLPSKDRTQVFYVLIEPDESQPDYQKNWYDGMNKTSELLSEYSSGYLKVEKRVLIE